MDFRYTIKVYTIVDYVSSGLPEAFVVLFVAEGFNGGKERCFTGGPEAEGGAHRTEKEKARFTDCQVTSAAHPEKWARPNEIAVPIPIPITPPIVDKMADSTTHTGPSVISYCLLAILADLREVAMKYD